MGGLEDVTDRSGIRIVPWGKTDLRLLQLCLSDPAMMQHLGGPEPAARIAERQRQYERPDSNQFKVVDAATGEGMGWVGYWERHWLQRDVYEIGWSVLPAFQGRGVGRAATRQAVEIARSKRTRRLMHAYPTIENAPSNAICRHLGFTLLGPSDFEYPKGNLLLCNDWQFDLLSGLA